MACLQPVFIQNKKPVSQKDRFISVPCGRCMKCLKRRASQWIFRLKQQDKVSSSALFVTLTYDTEFVPLTDNGFMSLSPDHHKNFMKRLRFSHGRKSIIKFYMAAEYGSQFGRPHYHYIMFNADRDKIQQAWPFGLVDIGDVSGASIGYVTGYVHKEAVVPLHKRDDRVREFSRMSKGLGINYITENIKQYHYADLDRFYVVESGNNKVAMPRYYRDKIYTDEHKKRFASKMQIVADENEAKAMDAYVARTGSLKGYARSKEEAIVQAFLHGNNYAKNRTQKL